MAGKMTVPQRGERMGMQDSLRSLDWLELLSRLANLAQTSEGQELLSRLPTDLNGEKVKENWNKIEPLRAIAIKGYRAPIGEVLPVAPYLRAANLGQLLLGRDLNEILALLLSAQKVAGFCRDFRETCSTLRHYGSRIQALPHLARDISKAIDAEGEVLDSASPELERIRRQKSSLRRQIEERVKRLLLEKEVEAYLQDDFFTVRNDRYVVPIKLDGRGRVKGSILATSDSGQTLFIEPTELIPFNDQLQEIEVSEKLEIIKIFKWLTGGVAKDSEAIRENHDALIELDVLTAEAQFAVQTDAYVIGISDTPCVQLYNARHPLIVDDSGKNVAVPNDVVLRSGESVLIISGPNAGGKTVVLKTVGLLTTMAGAGLLIPADPKSSIYLFDKVYVEMGDSQNISASLSTFSGHIMGLKPIVEKTKSTDLVLLDELAVGTDPQTGAGIAQAIVEDLAKRKIMSIVTTHFDSLKGLAVSGSVYRNGSMEFSEKSHRPTYKLLLDIPGQSYGLELAERIGFPKYIIERARELRGRSGSQLDLAAAELLAARAKVSEIENQLKDREHALDQGLQRWEDERKALEELRQTTTEKLRKKYESEFQELRSSLRSSLEEMKELEKTVRKQNLEGVNLEQLTNARGQTKQLLDASDAKIRAALQPADPNSNAPGKPLTSDQARQGAKVFVVPLGKSGVISKVTGEGAESVEVQVGIIKLRSQVSDLRLLEASPRGAVSVGSVPSAKKPVQAPAKPIQPVPNVTKAASLVLQTHTNSLDLRGSDVDSALEKTWRFIDAAMMRGEHAVVIIHGHGEDRLKKSIRQALTSESPYEIGHRPGSDNEGGDGVTIVTF